MPKVVATLNQKNAVLDCSLLTGTTSDCGLPRKCYNKGSDTCKLDEFAMDNAEEIPASTDDELYVEDSEYSEADSVVYSEKLWEFPFEFVLEKDELIE